MRGNVIKSILGIILIVVSVAGLFYWESMGRVKWTMVEVKAAAMDIKQGARLTEEMLKTIRVPKEELVGKAITSVSHNLSEVGRARQFIPANAQLSADFFETAKESLTIGKALFQIKNEWIESRSSTLRAGDAIAIYSNDGALNFGHFRTAFVKDEKDGEVTDDENGETEADLLNRKNAVARISHIEIWADLQEYEAIRGFAQQGGSLLIVQEGEDGFA